MTKKSGNDRQRNAGQDRVTGKCMAEIVQPGIGDACSSTDLSPKRELWRAIGQGIGKRRKDERTDPRLSGDDGLGLGAEKDRSRTGLRVPEDEPVSVNLRPAQADEFALSAPCQQQQTDDVGLLDAGAPPVMRVESLIEAMDLHAAQKARFPRARIASDGTGKDLM